MVRWLCTYFVLYIFLSIVNQCLTIYFSKILWERILWNEVKKSINMLRSFKRQKKCQRLTHSFNKLINTIKFLIGKRINIAIFQLLKKIQNFRPKSRSLFTLIILHYHLIVLKLISGVTFFQAVVNCCINNHSE